MSQYELPFEAPAPRGGYEKWQMERRAAKTELGRRLGLPLGHEVEVWLRGNVRLRGRLELAEGKLFPPGDNSARVQLAIGNASFPAGEIESCVRMG